MIPTAAFIRDGVRGEQHGRLRYYHNRRYGYQRGWAIQGFLFRTTAAVISAGRRLRFILKKKLKTSIALRRRGVAILERYKGSVNGQQQERLPVTCHSEVRANDARVALRKMVNIAVWV